jgi:proline iminopeptidase
LDNRGAGLSDTDSPETWSLDQLADDLKGFCIALDIVRPVVLGISFGGFIAMNAAARHKEMMSGLILCSTMARFDMARHLAVFERLGGPDIAAIAERSYREPTRENQLRAAERCGRFYSATPSDPDAAFRFRGALEMSSRVVAGLPAMDQRHLLGQIACPTLVLAGEDDPLCTLADGEEIADCLSPNVGRFVSFARAGHHLNRDVPKAYFDTIADFASSLPPLPAL